MTTPDVPPIALAGEPPICDVIDVLFSQKAAWTSELGYAINSSDFRHLLEKTGGIHAPTPSASSVPVATLHDDGYYTWHGDKPHGFNYQGWRMEVYAAPAANHAPSVLTDAQIIERMKSIGIEWSPGGRGEFGYSIGSFGRMSMDEVRALLQANGATK